MDEEGMSLHELFNILLRRLHWIAIVFISVLIIAAGYLFITNTQLYEATAKYTIESIGTLRTTTTPSSAVKDYTNELQYLQNENTFRTALELLNLQAYGETTEGYSALLTEKGIKKLIERVEISNPKGTYFIDIALTDPDPQFPIDFISALQTAYNSHIEIIVRGFAKNELESIQIQRDSIMQEYQSIAELSANNRSMVQNAGNGSEQTLPYVDEYAEFKLELQKEILEFNNTIAQYERLLSSAIESLRPMNEPKISEEASNSNNIMLILAVAVLLGLAFGVLIALLIDMTIPVIDHPDILYRTLGVEAPLITTIPLWNKNISHTFPELVTYGQGIEDLQEQYKLLGGTLLFTGSAQSHRCFSFSSQGLMEGSSFTVANLGVAFANSGKEVLLIDASDSSNSLSDIFNIQTSDTGLSDIVLRDQNWKNCVMEPLGDLTNLKVLPIGNGTNNRSAVVHNPKFKSVIQELTENFDIVLVDTPPFSYPSDMLAVAETTEGLILIVRSGLANRKRVKEVTSVLQTTNIPLLGIVMNGHYDAVVGVLGARQNYKHRIASSSMYKTLIRKASSRVN